MEFKSYLEAASKLPKGAEASLPKSLVKKLKEDHKTKDRTISKVYAFYNKDDSFMAYHGAEQKAKKMGYSVGIMQRDSPIALAKAKNMYIAKWWNIGIEEADRIDGVLVSDDMRDGDVYIVIFNKAAGKEKSKKEGEDNE